MAKYKSNFSEDGMREQDTILEGVTTKDIAKWKEDAQREVAENPEWLLAKDVMYIYDTCYVGDILSLDSSKILPALGFEIIGAADSLFYFVKPPEGWEKSTEDYWTSIFDENGKERIKQFYEGSILGTRAHLYFL